MYQTIYITRDGNIIKNESGQITDMPDKLLFRGLICNVAKSVRIEEPREGKDILEDAALLITSLTDKRIWKQDIVIQRETLESITEDCEPKIFEIVKPFSVLLVMLEVEGTLDELEAELDS